MTHSWLAFDSLISVLLSAIPGTVLLLAMLWIVLRRSALGLIFFFFLFAFAWRLISVLYIDLFGPTFSEQLDRDIGPGISALPLVISQGLVVAALLFSFRSGRVQSLNSADAPEFGSGLLPGRFALPDLAFWVVSLFVFALWVELWMKGSIPLFAGIERYDYSRLYGGALHLRLLDWGPMLAFQLGLFFAVRLLEAKSPDWRFGALYGMLILYLFLVGHRFSSLYAYTSFFIMPIGVVLLWRKASAVSSHEMVSRRMLRYLAIGGGAMSFLIAIAVTYSYFVVRGEGAEIGNKLFQRILVQQGEMWWMTYERVFVRGDWNAGFAAYRLFVDPFDPTRNSTMQLLMELGIPPERAHHILALGSAYTGGWPEVCFELGGPIGGFFLIALSAIVFSEFMFLLLRCIIQQRFATCFFLTPILYALSLNIVSGMVNSFVQLTFLAKALIALLVYVTEDRWRLSRLSAARAAPPSTLLPVPREEG